MEVVKIKNLSFGYNGMQDVIKDISLSIEKGEFLCIVGENGSRKEYINKMYFRTK